MKITGLGVTVTVEKIRTSWWRRPSIVLRAVVTGVGESEVKKATLWAGDSMECHITIDTVDKCTS